MEQSTLRSTRPLAVIVLSLAGLLGSACGGSEADELTAVGGQLIEDDPGCGPYVHVSEASITIRTTPFDIDDLEGDYDLFIEEAELAETSQACLVAAIDALVDELGFNSSIRDRISTTRALDGTQEAESSSYRAYWNYHPDNGANLIVEAKSE